jgi:PAS domain S-box-containing protein
LWRGLTEPHPAIRDPERRYRARLLSTVLGPTFLLVIVGTAVMSWQAGLGFQMAHPFYLLALASLVLLLVAYGLSRSPYDTLAAWFVVGFCILIVFATVIVLPQATYLLAFLVLGPFLSSLFLSTRLTLVMTVVVVVGILLLPVFVPQLGWAEALSVLHFVVVMVILSLISASIHQRHLGQIHLQTDQIRQMNTELAQRVAERATQLHVAVREQQATQGFLAHVLATSPAVIYVAKATGDYGATFVSANVAAQLGYQPHEFTDDSDFWVGHIHPEDAQAVLAELPRLFEQGHHTYEYRFRHQDGGYRWMRDEMNLVRDAAGAPREIIGAWFDITERKAHEEVLRRALAATARGQHLLLALSLAAHTVQRARTPDEIYRAIGDEVVKLGCHATIFGQTPDRGHLVIRYLTFAPAIVQAAERLAGLSMQDFRYAIVPGGIFDRICIAQQALFFEHLTEPVTEILPRPLRPLVGPLMALFKLERGIYAPLTVNGEPYGLLVVIGADLAETDAPAMTAFAGQIAIALENVRLLQEMQARAAEKEILLRELHHRVKNNLQIIASLLNMQARETPPVDVPTLVAETSDRVRSMALIHEKLYRATDLSQVDFSDYLESMAWALLQTYGADPAAIALRFACQRPATLDLNTAILCGLIANELVSNALKHAFPAGHGEITIAFHIAPAGRCTLSVADDGVGLPPQALAGAERGFGLRLVEMLTEQLGGRLEVQAAPVVKFEVTWPG